MAKAKSFSIDKFVEEAILQNVERFGADSVYAAAEHKEKLLTVPIPHLSLQWLVESTGWPLGRYTQSAGPFGSFKSSFAFQLCDWFLRAGGIVLDIDTEGKTSAELRNSVVSSEFTDKSNKVCRRFQHGVATSINEWQRMLVYNLENFKQKLADTGTDKVDAPPYLLVVDSLNGVSSEESIKRLMENGSSAGRAFSEDPMVISRFYKESSGFVGALPVCVHLTNHEKPDLMQANVMRRPGGVAPDYYATLDIQFKRGPYGTAMGTAATYEYTTYNGRTVKMKMRKSSMGTNGKELCVCFKWTYKVDASGRMEQVSWWDFEEATAMLIQKFAKRLKHLIDVASVAKRLKAGNTYPHFYVTGGNEALCSGLPTSADTALPANVFGALIESNPALMAELQNELHIHPHPIVTRAQEFMPNTTRQRAMYALVGQAALLGGAVAEDEFAGKGENEVTDVTAEDLGLGLGD
jgi:RecA/RadA recombinase